MIILAGIVPLTVGVITYLVWRNGHITGVKAERWAASRGLTLTPENRPAVVEYLHNAGLLRGLGLLAGLVLPQLWSWALGLHPSGIPPWTWAFLGYLVGALYAEISLRRPKGNRAAVTPRRLGDYVKPLVLRGQMVLGFVLVITALAVSLLPDDNDPFTRSRAALIAAFTVGLVGTPALLMVERWLVLRPQPFLSPAQLAADDAIRSQSIQSIAASGMAMHLTFLAVSLFALSTSDVQALRPCAVLGLIPMWLAVLVCFNVGQIGWRVRRPLPSSPQEVASC